MPKIIKHANHHGLIDLMQITGVESYMIPSLRFLHAQERGNEDDVMFLAPDALGDNVCMLPSVQYALTMPGLRVSVATQWTELYEHLPLANLINLKIQQIPSDEEFFNIKAYPYPDELSNDFFNSFGTQLVDYISMNLLRQQLPLAYRDIRIRAKETHCGTPPVVIHPGASWPSKTFPKQWWDDVLDGLHRAGVKPWLVGRSGIVDKGGQLKGTVDVNANGCLDLRDKLSTLELADVLQKAKVVITNDSGPLHIAASGTAWIGMLATVLRPENVTHWRRPDDCIKNQWGWRTEDLALGGIYQDNPLQPNVSGSVYDSASTARLEKWLPEPKAVADWALSKLGL